MVEIPFEEVSFKASFEGGEGRAVTESERKKIPDFDSREANGTTTMVFSFEKGEAKYVIIRRRAQRPRRDIKLSVLRQINQSSYIRARRETETQTQTDRDRETETEIET